jgi:hypothetical protein
VPHAIGYLRFLSLDHDSRNLSVFYLVALLKSSLFTYLFYNQLARQRKVILFSVMIFTPHQFFISQAEPHKDPYACVDKIRTQSLKVYLRCVPIPIQSVSRRIMARSSLHSDMDQQLLGFVLDSQSSAGMPYSKKIFRHWIDK